MGALVIGLGQEVAGDDGIGFAVVEAVRREERGGIRTEFVSDPSDLVHLLATSDPVVIVDAVIGGGSPPGTVAAYEAAAFSSLPQSSVSTHGIGIRQAIDLARALHAEAVSPRISVVGIHIERPTNYGFEPSCRVAAALHIAKARVLSLCEASNA